MDLAPPVEAQDDVVHLPVAEIDHLVIDQHSVGSEGEAEFFIAFPLARAGVGDEPLDDLPVHQRLPAEEVNLKVDSAAGMGDQEFERLTSHLKTHQCPLAVVFSLAGEAVVAVEVAGVGHVQAQRLDNGVAALEVEGLAGVDILSVELARAAQRLDVVETVKQLLPGDLGISGVLFKKDLDGLPGALGFAQPDQVVGDLVHHVDRTAEHIENDIVAVELVGMNHLLHSSFSGAEKGRSTAKAVRRRFSGFPN